MGPNDELDYENGDHNRLSGRLWLDFQRFYKRSKERLSLRVEKIKEIWESFLNYRP